MTPRSRPIFCAPRRRLVSWRSMRRTPTSFASLLPTSVSLGPTLIPVERTLGERVFEHLSRADLPRLVAEGVLLLGIAALVAGLLT